MTNTISVKKLCEVSNKTSLNEYHFYEVLTVRQYGNNKNVTQNWLYYQYPKKCSKMTKNQKNSGKIRTSFFFSENFFLRKNFFLLVNFKNFKSCSHADHAAAERQKVGAGLS